MTAKPEFELVLDLILDAPREKLFRCYSDPNLLKQWFAPKPWTISKVDNDVRAGGRFSFTMASPDGQELPNTGVYLDVVPNEKIVTTDAFTEGFIPSGQPFMVAQVTFEDAPGGKTHYVARAMHWNAETKEQHAKMGFHEGWGQTAKQLEALAKTI